MTLEPKQYSIILEQLEKENISEFVEALIISYATDVNRTSQLLSLIPKIAEMQLKIMKNEVVDYSIATNLLMSECINNKKCDFATLLYTCKVYFPKGNSDGASPDGIEFFKRFIYAIKNKKGFDYESNTDWDRVCNIAQCESWMLTVIRQNVNADFNKGR
jgi:hypothetical protein